MSPLVLAEVGRLAAARFGSQARTSLIDFILFQARGDRFLLPHVTIDLLETGRSVQPKYAALNLDLADAVNVALATDYRSHSLLTLDRRDSRAISPLTPAPGVPTPARRDVALIRHAAGHACPIASRQDVEPANARQRDSPMAVCGKPTAQRSRSSHARGPCARGRYGPWVVPAACES